MAEPDGTGGPRTYTQQELDALIAEAKKPLEAKRDELLTEAKTAKQLLQELGGAQHIKTELEELQEIRAELARIEQEEKAEGAGITKDKLDEIRKQIKADLEKQYTPFKEQNGALQAKIRELTLDNVVKGQMPKHGVRPERVDALFRVAREFFDLTDDLTPVVKGQEGRDVGKFIEEDLSKDWPEFFAGTGSSGGGASRSSASGGGYRRTIAADDSEAFMSNLEAIAKGDVRVES